MNDCPLLYFVAIGVSVLLILDMLRLGSRCPHCRTWFGHRETDTMTVCRKCNKLF